MYFNQEGRKKNALLISASGVMTGALRGLLAFAYRTIFIRCLSADYLGLTGLFGNVLQMLSLADLGLTTVLAFRFYDPVSRDDVDHVGRLMNYTRKVYRAIILIILGIGAAAVPFIPLLIRDAGEVPPDVSLYVIYGLFLINTLSTYLFSWRLTLLTADQKAHMVSWISLGAYALAVAVQTLILIFRGSYTESLAAGIVCTMAVNLAASIYTTRKYREVFRIRGSVTREESRGILKDAKAAMMHRIGSVVVTGTDSAVLTRLAGLTAAGLYANYSLIVTGIQGVLTQMLGSFTATVGNARYAQEKDAYYETYRRDKFLSLWVATVMTGCMYACLDDFILAWVGQGYVLGRQVTAVICAWFWLSLARVTEGVFTDAGGLFIKDRFRPLIEAALNLGISIALTMWIGIAGVFAGTVLSYALTAMWRQPLILYREEFHRPVREYWRMFAEFAIPAVLLCAAGYSLKRWGQEVGGTGLERVVFEAVLFFLLGNGLLILLYRRRKEFASLTDAARGLWQRLWKGQEGKHEMTSEKAEREVKNTDAVPAAGWGNRAYRLARLAYMTAAVLMILCQMINSIQRTSTVESPGNFFTMVAAVQLGCRGLLILAALEKCLRKRKEGLLILGILALSWVASRNSHNYNQLFDFAAILLLSDLTDRKKGLRAVAWTYLAGIALLFLLVAENWSGAARAMTGMANKNAEAALAVGLALLIWQLMMPLTRRMKPWTAFLAMLPLFWGTAAFTYLKDECLTGTAAAVVFPFLWAAFRRIGAGKHEKLLKPALLVPLMAALLSGALTVFMANVELPELPMPWSNLPARFNNEGAVKAIQQFGITLFGSTEATARGYTTDNLYLNNLICHGIIGEILLLGLFTWSLWTQYRNRRYDLMAMTVLFLAYGLMECIGMVLMFNFAILLTRSPEKEPEGIRPFSLSPKARIAVSCAILAAGAVLACVLPMPVRVTRSGNNGTITDFKSYEEITDGKELSQRINIGNQYQLRGVRFKTSTYKTQPLRGEVVLTLIDSDGNLLEEKRAGALSVHDNSSWISFWFDGTYPPGKYTVTLRAEDIHGGRIGIRQKVTEANGNKTVTTLVRRVYDWKYRPDLKYLLAGYIALSGILFIWIVPGNRKKEESLA